MYHLRDFNTLLNLCIIDDTAKMIGYGQHGIAFLSAYDYIRYKIKIQRHSVRSVMCRNLNSSMRRFFSLRSAWSGLVIVI